MELLPKLLTEDEMIFAIIASTLKAQHCIIDGRHQFLIERGLFAVARRRTGCSLRYRNRGFFYRFRRLTFRLYRRLTKTLRRIIPKLADPDSCRRAPHRDIHCKNVQ
jgi:hypothetical protein